MLRHGDGGGIGQLVGRTHHEGLKGEFGGGEPLALLLGHIALEFGVVLVVQDPHLKIRGEDVVEGGLDVFHEKGFDVPLFKIVGAMQNKDVALDVHGLQFVKPGGDGGLGQFFFQLLQDVVPHVSNGIHRNTSL